jgi:hypothetical protein
MAHATSSARSLLLPLSLLAASFSWPAHAQTETGTIYGSVADPTGAVVPNTSVRLIDSIADLKPKWQLATEASTLSPMFVPAITGWKQKRKERIQTRPSDGNHRQRPGQFGPEF